MTTDRELYDRIYRSLTNQTPTEEQVERIEDIRTDGRNLGMSIIDDTRPSREQSLALTKLEECIMWAVKAIVLEQPTEGEGNG